MGEYYNWVNVDKKQREMDHLRELLKQKENEVTSSEDIYKVNRIKELFTDDGIFFKMRIETAYGILSFLGIPKEDIETTYSSLTSPEEYMKTSKPYFMGSAK